MKTRLIKCWNVRPAPSPLSTVLLRGDRREPIFEDDEDRRTFLHILGAALERFDACLLAYCLMDNHYHLVVQTRQGNLSRLMRQINGVYTQTYNRRHAKVGHLFQGRFKAILVDGDTYLLEVCMGPGATQQIYLGDDNFILRMQQHSAAARRNYQREA